MASHICFNKEVVRIQPVLRVLPDSPYEVKYLIWDTL